MQVAAGSGHSLVLLESSQVYSWGNNTQGSCGFENLICTNEPTLIRGSYKAVSAGTAHSTGITLKGELVVWGTNKQCQLGYNQKLREVSHPVLFGGQVEPRTCAPYLSETVKQFQDSLLGPNLEYLQAECSSYLTVCRINQSPFVLICGNGSHVCWSPQLGEPRLIKCVGQQVYIMAEAGLYKIESASRAMTLLEKHWDFAGSGLDFEVKLADDQVFASGRNENG